MTTGGVEPPRGGTYYADEDINLLPLSDEDAPLRTLRGRGCSDSHEQEATGSNEQSV